MPEQDVLIRVRHRVPRVGHPERAEEHRVIAREVDALAAERDHRERHVDGTLQEARALLPDPEERELDLDLVEEALGRGQDPRALRCVGVEHHGQELEGGGPLGDGAGLTAEGGELDVGVDQGDHMATLGRHRGKGQAGRSGAHHRHLLAL